MNTPLDIPLTLYLIMLLPSVIGAALFFRFMCRSPEPVSFSERVLMGMFSLVAGIFWPVIGFAALCVLVVYGIGTIASSSVPHVPEEPESVSLPDLERKIPVDIKDKSSVPKIKVEVVVEKVEDPAILFRTRKL